LLRVGIRVQRLGACCVKTGCEPSPTARMVTGRQSLCAIENLSRICIAYRDTGRESPPAKPAGFSWAITPELRPRSVSWIDVWQRKRDAEIGLQNDS
jgi:hypothetical protein